MEEIFYVLYDPEEKKFVDIDSNSGGYPYLTSLKNAHQFATYKDADKYKRGMFSPDNTYKANWWKVLMATISTK